ALDEREELLVRRRLGERDLHAWPRGGVAAHQVGEDALADALVDADAQDAALALRERAEVGLGGCEPGADRLGVAEQELAGFGQRHRPRPTRAVDEPRPDDALERRDLLAHGRLGVPEALRGPAER